jgi:hypothetical protein
MVSTIKSSCKLLYMATIQSNSTLSIYLLHSPGQVAAEGRGAGDQRGGGGGIILRRRVDNQTDNANGGSGASGNG